MRATYRFVAILLAITVGICSMAVFKPIFSSTSTYSYELERLDDKRNDIVALAAASSIASTLLTISPGDIANPLANQLADLSKIFVLILSIVIAEKYLLTLLGSLSIYLVFASSLIMLIYFSGYRKQWVLNVFIKLTILAIAFGSFIPISIRVIDKIEDTHRESIDMIVSNAIDSEKELETESERNEKDFGAMITGAINDIGNTIAGTAINIYEKAKETAGKFIEAAAVMVVTSCVIPILTLILYALTIRHAFGLNFEIGTETKQIIVRYKKRNEVSKLHK